MRSALDSPRRPAHSHPHHLARLLVVSAILALGLILRLWGVTFGFPYVYHYDEPTYVRIALDLGHGIVGNQLNPTGFSNILFGEYAIWSGLGRLFRESDPGVAGAALWPADPTFVLIFLGRLTSAFLGTLTIAAALRLGKLTSGSTAGLVGATLLAVAFLHVRGSHHTVPDVAATFFVTAALLLAALAIRKRSKLPIFVAAAMAGIAVATKWTVAPVILPVALAAIEVRLARRDGPVRVPAVAGDFLALGILFAVGFFMGGFELLLEPGRYRDYLLLELSAGAAGGFWIWQVDTLPGWLYYLDTLSYGLGLVPLALALLGVARHVWQVFRTRDRTSALLLSFVLPYYVLMGSTRHYFARYALPMTPFLALFAADAVCKLLSWGNSRVGVRRMWVMGAVAVLVLVQPLASSIRHGVLLTRTDTRTLAKEWIENHVPAGAKLALDWPVYSPPLSRDMYVVSEQGGLGLAKHPLDWYRQEGFEYIVTSNFVYDLPLLDPGLASDRLDFYTSLDAELELLAQISPYFGSEPPKIIFEEIYGPAIHLWRRSGPGPVLRIYRVQ